MVLERVDFAKEKNADIFISIHQNSYLDRKNENKKEGTSAFYYNKESYNLADEIKNAIVKRTKLKDDGTNLASLAVIRTADPVSVLIECGYIANKKESEKLSDSNFQKNLQEQLFPALKTI